MGRKKKGNRDYETQYSITKRNKLKRIRKELDTQTTDKGRAFWEGELLNQEKPFTKRFHRRKTIKSSKY